MSEMHSRTFVFVAWANAQNIQETILSTPPTTWGNFLTP